MHRLLIVGASHGQRLYEALTTLPGYGTAFTAVNYCKRGKRFCDLEWPLSVEKSDIVIIIPFGNDLTPRANVSYCRTDRVIHLLKFVPFSSDHWEKLYSSLQKRLDSLDCKKVLIDNIYRHLCCDTHRFSGWLTYQKQLNKQLKARFSSLSCFVIDHRRLLPLSYNQSKSVLAHRKLQTDSVHFRDYRPIAEKLLKRLPC